MKAALSIVLNDSQNSILLVKRRDVPVWVLPGGGVEKGETTKNAAIRETLEESGLSISITGEAAKYTPTNRFTENTYLFYGKVNHGKLSKGEETADACFFPLDALPSSLFFIHLGWIKELIPMRTTPIHRPLSEITYGVILRSLLRHPYLVLRFAWTALSKKR